MSIFRIYTLYTSHVWPGSTVRSFLIYMIIVDNFCDNASLYLFFCTESSDNSVGDSGRGFMIDLLIDSLMVEGNLESAFESAVQAEIEQEVNDHPPEVLDVSNHPPLLQLARELLRNSANTCLSRFQLNKRKSDDLSSGSSKQTKRSSIMELLLKLQRLLIGSVFTVFIGCHRTHVPEKGTAKFD